MIGQHAPAAQVVSLQNGMANAATLRAVLAEAGPLPHLSHRRQRWHSVDNIEAVQWGKLLINLAHELNALARMPLPEQVQDRARRRLMADQMRKAATTEGRPDHARQDHSGPAALHSALPAFAGAPAPGDRGQHADH